MSAVNVQLVGVFPRRTEDKGNHLAKVAFAFRQEGMMPLKLTRDYKTESGEWRTFELGEIEGECTVRVRDARLYDGERGPFINVSGMTVPYDVRQLVAELAHAELKNRQAGAPASAGKGAA